MNKSYQIKSFELGPMDNLIHIVWDIATKKAAVFDPAWDADFILDFVNKNGLTLDKILITHSHFDHINAIPELISASDGAIYIDQQEYFHPQAQVFPKDVNFVSQDTIIELGQTRISCIATPGHSIGGVCYQLSHDVITGDTIFIYGSGHCALPGADVNKLFLSLKTLKQKLDPELIVHTSHTYGISNTSTWQQQLDGNPFLHFDNLADFINFRNNIHDNIRTYPMQPITKAEIAKYLS